METSKSFTLLHEETLEEYKNLQKFLLSGNKFKELRSLARSLMSPTQRTLLYQEHSVSVYKYQSPKARITDRPLLVVPSLVNRPSIMDHLESESFIAAMIERGIPVYMIEWGEQIQSQRNVNLEQYLTGYLSRACRRVAWDQKTDGIHMAGYCLGGTLATVFCGLDQGDWVKSLVTMVTPLNFHDQGLLSWWAREEHFDVDKIVDTWGNVPAHFFSSSFPWLVPTAPIKKARTLYQKQDDEEFLVRFLALDLWISENIDFPGEVYREIIKLGYQKNVLVDYRKWPFSAGDSDLSKITFPVLNMVAAYDHVSPPESCSLVGELLANANCETRNYETGHLGFALGKDKSGQSTSRYWDEIVDWLKIVESKEK